MTSCFGEFMDDPDDDTDDTDDIDDTDDVAGVIVDIIVVVLGIIATDVTTDVAIDVGAGGTIDATATVVGGILEVVLGCIVILTPVGLFENLSGIFEVIEVIEVVEVIELVEPIELLLGSKEREDIICLFCLFSLSFSGSTPSRDWLGL